MAVQLSTSLFKFLFKEVSDERRKGELEYKQIRQVLDAADGDGKFRDEIAGQITVVG